MKTNYNNNTNTNQMDKYNSTPEYHCNEISECNKYKQKSDELYIKGTCMQDEVKRLFNDAKELEEYAEELERQAKQIHSQVKIIRSNAKKLETETQDTLILASFYCNKAIDSCKNLKNAMYSN